MSDGCRHFAALPNSFTIGGIADIEQAATIKLEFLNTCPSKGRTPSPCEANHYNDNNACNPAWNCKASAMLTLFSYPDLCGVADNNPYGLKVYAFLKLCD